MPPPLPAFCEMRLCYKYYKFDARNHFIGSLFTDFQYKCFFAAIKGRVTFTTSDFCDKRKNVPNFVGNFFPSTSEIFEFCLKVARSFDWRSFLLWIVSLEIGSFFLRTGYWLCQFKAFTDPLSIKDQTCTGIYA